MQRRFFFCFFYLSLWTSTQAQPANALPTLERIAKQNGWLSWGDTHKSLRIIRESNAGRVDTLVWQAPCKVYFASKTAQGQSRHRGDCSNIAQVYETQTDETSFPLWDLALLKTLPTDLQFFASRQGTTPVFVYRFKLPNGQTAVFWYDQDLLTPLTRKLGQVTQQQFKAFEGFVLPTEILIGNEQIQIKNVIFNIDTTPYFKPSP